MVRTSHVVLAVLLHVVVLGMLLIGFRCTRKVEPPPVIQATIVDEKPSAPAPPPKVEPEPAPPKEDPQKLIEEQRKLEEERRLEEEQALKQAEIRAQRKAEELARQQEARKRAEEESRRKKEEAARKAKEEQARREALKKKQQQEELEAELRRQLSSEETARQSQARATEQQLWLHQIQEKVKRNWLRPPGSAEDFACKVQVQLLPGGQVVGVKLLSSCGNPILDDSVQRAVLRSDPLPTPSDPAIFEREINFNFIP